MTLQVLQCSNGLHHVNLDVSAAPWKMVNVFEIFGVQHINRADKIQYLYTLGDEIFCYYRHQCISRPKNFDGGIFFMTYSDTKIFRHKFENL